MAGKPGSKGGKRQLRERRLEKGTTIAEIYPPPIAPTRGHPCAQPKCT